MTQTQQFKRFLSLDILRGLTVASMITVNNPGSWGEPTFAPLRHAAWDGCTPTDLVFPFFCSALARRSGLPTASRTTN